MWLDHLAMAAESLEEGPVVFEPAAPGLRAEIATPHATRWLE